LNQNATYPSSASAAVHTGVKVCKKSLNAEHNKWHLFYKNLINFLQYRFE